MIKEKYDKYVVIGDVHGLPHWKEIAARYTDSCIIFLGDYGDPYPESHVKGRQALQNLESIIDFKMKNPNRVELLLGNHDTHYFVLKSPIGSRYDIDQSINYMELFSHHSHLFDYSFQLETLLFSHAGISNGWFQEVFKGEQGKNVALQINQRIEDDAIYSCSILRGGKDKFGGILWADKNELNHILPGYIQIVGHNQVPNITLRTDGGKFCKDIGHIIFCDCLSTGTYLLIEGSDSKFWNFLEKSINNNESRNILRFDRERLCI